MFPICKRSDLACIKADFSFFLFIAMLFMFRDSRTILNIFIVCGLHEWTHLAVMFIYKAEVREIRMSGLGIRIITKKSGTEPLFQSLVILLSGPAMNILLYVILRKRLPDTAMLSLGAGVYNLLPFRQLDGGAAVELLIQGSRYEHIFRKGLMFLKIVIAAALLCIIFVDLFP